MDNRTVTNIIFIALLIGTILMLYLTYKPSMECTKLLNDFDNKLNGTMMDTCNICIRMYENGIIYRSEP